MSIHYIRNSRGEITSVRAVAGKIAGAQTRRTFSVKLFGKLSAAEKAAKEWIEEEKEDRRKGRRHTIAVPDRVLEDVLQCLELLQPHGKRLLDVVREYVERPERRTLPWTFRDAADAFLASRRATGARPQYLRGLEDTYNLAAKTFGPKLLDEITTEALESWLTRPARGKPLSSVTYRNYRRDLRMLWRFAIQRHRATHDPVTPIAVPAINQEPVKILKAPELKKLLDAASPVAQTYIAVMAFAGVRPFEVLQLSQLSIDERSLIRIEGSHAKSRKRRLVTISHNLTEWLRKGEGYLGQVQSYWTLNSMIRAAARTASIALTQDILRHSFASHHLALYRNAALTAHELGHHSQQVLFEHYREVVTQEEAQAYFGLVPP